MKIKMSILALALHLIVSSGLFWTTCAVVVDLDDETDLVTVEYWTGDQFAFYGIEDYCEGDLVTLLMYTRGTPEICDDVILLHRAEAPMAYWNTLPY